MNRQMPATRFIDGWGRTIRSVGAIAGFALSLLTAGCNTVEERLIEQGIGTELPAVDIAESTRKLNDYLFYLCDQAGIATTAVVDGLASPVACGTNGPVGWTPIVKAGFNDIDRRCDSYLAWLNSRRRNQAAILNQIHDTRTFTEALLFTTGVSAAPITIAGLAFGLASNTFTNYYSRLLFEVEKSTVGVVVREKRLEYRAKFNMLVTNQPDAVHLLREYLLVCTPFYFEDLVNQRTRDSVAGNVPADVNDADQIRRSVVAGSLIGSIPKTPRDPLPKPPVNEKMIGGANDTERALSKAFGQTIQANLCVPPNGQFDQVTREAIHQAKAGANGSRSALTSPPIFRSPVTSSIDSGTEEQIFLDARGCSKDSAGADRGYQTAYEKFRLGDEKSVKDLQASLKLCDARVEQSGIFDSATRAGIMTATSKTGAGVPKTNRLDDNKTYLAVKGICAAPTPASSPSSSPSPSPQPTR
jgi:hypothetical protein